MGTVSKEIARKIKDNNGYYGNDPRCWRIVEYDNAWGGIGYGLEYAQDIGKYQPSEFIQNPRVFWQAEELTRM